MSVSSNDPTTVHFQYVHLRRHRHPVTVAFQVTGRDQISFGVAVCAAKDRFNRALGRTIASGRLAARPVLMAITPTGDETFNQAVSRTIRETLTEQAPVTFVGCKHADGEVCSHA